jgi:hypothetical protein
MLKLSEAIRLGSMMVPKTTRALFCFDGDGQVIAACALGAARLALGPKWASKSAEDLIFIREWEDLFRIQVHNPVHDPAFSFPNIRRLDDVIISLNDGYGWTRQRIADWVELIERRQGMWDAPAEIAPMEVTEAVCV